jgi:hypothetical protein
MVVTDRKALAMLARMSARLTDNYVALGFVNTIAQTVRFPDDKIAEQELQSWRK